MHEDLLPILIFLGLKCANYKAFESAWLLSPFAHVFTDKNHVSKVQKLEADETYAYV
jgi:hypothetical protein